MTGKKNKNQTKKQSTKQVKEEDAKYNKEEIKEVEKDFQESTPSPTPSPTPTPTNNLINPPKLSNRKFEEIPIVAHEMPKPIKLFTEFNDGRNNIPLGLNIRPISTNSNWNKVNATRKFEDIPIQSHHMIESTKSFQEYSTQKLNLSNISSTNDCYNVSTKSSLILNKKRVFEKIQIQSYETHSTNLLFYDYSYGRENIFKSQFTYPTKLCDKICTNGWNNKPTSSRKFEEIPISCHETIKPSKLFEDHRGQKLSYVKYNISQDNNLIKLGSKTINNELLSNSNITLTTADSKLTLKLKVNAEETKTNEKKEKEPLDNPEGEQNQEKKIKRKRKRKQN